MPQCHIVENLAALLERSIFFSLKKITGFGKQKPKANTHTHANTDMHTDTHIDTQRHTHSHTHRLTHTHIQLYALS